MLHQETKPPAMSWQDLICRLEGVYAAKVVLCEDGTPEEIHILASTAKSPKSLTRDIQSALMAAFGVEVDYRIISIAQIHPDMSEKDSRLCYSGIENKFIDGRGEITVFLSYGDLRIEGKSSYATRNTASQLRGVALATLDAVSKFITEKNSAYYELITSEVIEIGGRPATLVTVCDEQGQHYIGSSLIREHHDDAVVRAVMDALNRRVSRFIAE